MLLFSSPLSYMVYNSAHLGDICAESVSLRITYIGVTIGAWVPTMC